jgi:hypothetical protein
MPDVSVCRGEQLDASSLPGRVREKGGHTASLQKRRESVKEAQSNKATGGSTSGIVFRGSGGWVAGG